MTPPLGPRGTIALVMIVRDEAAVIERCLRSCLPIVDSYCICDTGSSDDTIAIIERCCAAAGVPGMVHQRDWVDFGHNRTESMALARGSADWLFTIDADMTLEAVDEEFHLPAPVPLGVPAERGRVDEIHLRVEPHDQVGLIFWQPHFMRGDLPWRYRGAYHEALQRPRDDVVAVTLHEPHLFHHGHGESADSPEMRRKFEHAYELLLDDHRRDPEDARTVFYLARTAGALCRWQPHRWMEALRLYRQRALMDGYDEETFYARMMAGALLLDRDLDEAIVEMLRAYELRPTRAEPLWYLARACKVSGREALAELLAEKVLRMPVPVTTDSLFLDLTCYPGSAVPIAAAEAQREEAAAS